MTDPVEVDLSGKKSESEWQDLLDAFVLEATPKIYEWLRWVLTLAALTYVQHKSKSTALSVLLAVTGSLTFLYFLSFFYQIRIKNIPFLKRSRVALFASLLVSGLLGGITWLLVNEAVRAVVSSQP